MRSVDLWQCVLFWLSIHYIKIWGRFTKLVSIGYFVVFWKFWDFLRVFDYPLLFGFSKKYWALSNKMTEAFRTHARLLEPKHQIFQQQKILYPKFYRKHSKQTKTIKDNTEWPKTKQNDQKPNRMTKNQTEWPKTKQNDQTQHGMTKDNTEWPNTTQNRVGTTWRIVENPGKVTIFGKTQCNS